LLRWFQVRCRQLIRLLRLAGKARMIFQSMPALYAADKRVLAGVHLHWLRWSLLQALVDAIDYVITHELCHIFEHDRSARYYILLNRVMAAWK